MNASVCVGVCVLCALCNIDGRTRMKIEKMKKQNRSETHRPEYGRNKGKNKYKNADEHGFNGVYSMRCCYCRYCILSYEKQLQQKLEHQ